MHILVVNINQVPVTDKICIFPEKWFMRLSQSVSWLKNAIFVKLLEVIL